MSVSHRTEQEGKNATQRVLSFYNSASSYRFLPHFILTKSTKAINNAPYLPHKYSKHTIHVSILIMLHNIFHIAGSTVSLPSHFCQAFDTSLALEFR